jgi:hypothetical protein
MAWGAQYAPNPRFYRRAVKPAGCAAATAVELQRPQPGTSESDAARKPHAGVNREQVMTSRPLFAALFAFASVLSAASAWAQTAPPGDANASMVKPPGAAAASATRPNNPDNMPVKRPVPPPNSDRMLHHSPASDAIAK